MTLLTAQFAEHIANVKSVRHAKGLPCADEDVPTLAKLSALGEEYGEVCRAIQDEAPIEHLRSELFDVATVAVLWAGSLS